jgi:hypothetical protein
MIVSGVLTLLSLMLGDSGVVSKWWSDTLYKSTGWGAYAIPVILIMAGAWFLLRKLDQFPDLSSERIIGIMLIFFNALGGSNSLARSPPRTAFPAAARPAASFWIR